VGIFDSIKNALGGKEESAPATAEPPQAPAADSIAGPEVAERDPAEPAKTGSGAQTYTVQSGDTLWKISEQLYGNGSSYMKIFEANTAILEHPDQIFPGQELVIPEL
jgi:nucleoid-associated protein YgaU